VNAEHVRVVADDHQPVQPVGAGDHGNAAGRLLGVAALGFSNDGLLGNAFADQVFLAHKALGVLIAAGTAEGDDERGDAAMVELERVVEPRAVDGRRPAIVLRRAKNADGVGGRSLILIRVDLNLQIDPAAPAKAATSRAEDKNNRNAEDPVAALRLGFGPMISILLSPKGSSVFRSPLLSLTCSPSPSVP
jgi:hypothetical protein